MDDECVLKYYSAGSYGVLVKNISNNFIYKITEFSNYLYISGNNFNEMIYLNYFKNKYPKLYMKLNNNLPIQNISTHIQTLNYFAKQHKIDNELLIKITKKLNINSINLVIINKMKFYPFNLYELKKKSIFSIDNLYFQMEKIILGLHFFHSEGLAHGDLKLTNIVSDKNDCKIADFGGVKYILNPVYDCTCTPTYKSPEDYEYEYEYEYKHDYEYEYKYEYKYGNLIKLKSKTKKIYLGCPIKSDIWSLGIIFNELLNKFNPIQDKYNQFNDNIMTNEDIEYKIHLYLKKKT